MTSKKKKKFVFAAIAGVAGVAVFIFRKPIMAQVEKLKARFKK